MRVAIITALLAVITINLTLHRSHQIGVHRLSRGGGRWWGPLPRPWPRQHHELVGGLQSRPMALGARPAGVTSKTDPRGKLTPGPQWKSDPPPCGNLTLKEKLRHFLFCMYGLFFILMERIQNMFLFSIVIILTFMFIEKISTQCIYRNMVSLL